MRKPLDNSRNNVESDIIQFFDPGVTRISIHIDRKTFRAGNWTLIKAKRQRYLGSLLGRENVSPILRDKIEPIHEFWCVSIEID